MFEVPVGSSRRDRVRLPLASIPADLFMRSSMLDTAALGSPLTASGLARLMGTTLTINASSGLPRAAQRPLPGRSTRARDSALPGRERSWVQGVSVSALSSFRAVPKAPS